MEVLYNGISDEEILSMIRARIICLGTDGHVYKWHSKWKKYHRMKRRIDIRDQRANYQLGINKRNRTIVVSVLMWMFDKLDTVPINMDIDHINHDKTNDNTKNLRARDSSENRADNWSKKNFDEVAEFFDNIAASTCKF